MDHSLCFLKVTFFPRWYFIYLIIFKFNFIFGCVGSSLLRVGFLYFWQAEATLRCGVWPSHCSGFSCCGARALGVRASVVAACRLGCVGFSSCGVQAQ